MATIDISNVINVTVTGTPSGLTEANINSVALFTTEAPSNADVYRTYVSASQVAEDFGTSSVTAQMANNVFAQSPNILSGKGRLVIIPMQSAVSATTGDFVTGDISANLTNFQSITDGEVRIILNGVNRDIVGLDFTRATSLSDVADIIKRKIPDVTITATATAITIESQKVGDNSTVVLASTGGSGTDLSGAGYLDVSGGTASTGANATGETLVEAIARTENDIAFVGVMTNLNMEDAVVEATATAIQAQNRIFVHHFASTEDFDGICTTIKDASQTKTRCLVYTNSLEDANLYKSAYVGRMFSVNTQGSNTAITANLKPLANVVADSGMNQTYYDKAKSVGADIYVSYGGLSGVLSTGGNKFFDNVYMDLALKFALETAGFNYIRQTNTKIPQTEAGMNGFKAVQATVLDRFVSNGYIGVGLSWNSSETFGNPEIFRENIKNVGYYIYSQPIAQQDPVERSQRIAPLTQIAVKRSGAFHEADILVVVND